MVITPHLLAGAVIGAHSPNVWAAFCFGLISHYLLDALPHWEYLDNLKMNGKLKMFAKISLDFIIGVIIIFALIWDYPQKLIIISALIGSLLPDALEFFYANFKMKWLKFFHDFHNKIHYYKKVSFLKGSISQVVIIGISIILLFWG